MTKLATALLVLFLAAGALADDHVDLDLDENEISDMADLDENDFSDDMTEVDDQQDYQSSTLDVEESEDNGCMPSVTSSCQLSSSCPSVSRITFKCDNYQGKGKYRLTYRVEPRTTNFRVQGCSSCTPGSSAAEIVTGSSSSRSSRCSQQGGRCQDIRRNSCSGTVQSGLCPGSSNIRCCFSAPSGGSSSGSCGAYTNAATRRIQGNNGVTYTVVMIRRDDLTYPSYANFEPTKKDNSMTKDTACAFAQLKAACPQKITINSGFRTIARQQYFWNCYQTKKCNNGNKAARPGTSNHGRGVALDLQLSSSAYSWMSNNAARFGFVRTVSSERWHWEYRPGSRCNAFVRYTCR